MRTIRQFHLAEKGGGKFNLEKSQKISGDCGVSLSSTTTKNQLINNNLNKSIYQSRTYHHRKSDSNLFSQSYHGYHPQNPVPLKNSHSNNTYIRRIKESESTANNNSINTTAVNTQQSNMYANYANNTTTKEINNSNRLVIF